MLISSRGHINSFRSPSDYFAGPYLKHAWDLRENLLDSVGGNHLIAADVWNGTGTFAASTGFTLTGAATISGGKLNLIAGAGTGVSRATTVIAGKTYEIEGTVDAIGGNGITVRMGTTGTAVDVTATGPFKVQSICAGSTSSFILAKDAAASATVDNVTIREVYNGNFNDGAVFNGVSNCLQTTSSIDLTAYNKVCVLADIKHITYNLAAAALIFETSTILGSTAGAFGAFQGGNSANDPFIWSVRGNVGQNQPQWYFNTLVALNDKNFHSYALTGDFSLATNEAVGFFDGQLKTPSIYAANVNNTGNFGNYVLYIGARAGTIFFANVAVKNMAIIAGWIPSSEDIADYQAWKDDISTPNRISLFLEGGLKSLPWLSVKHRTRKL